MTGLAYVLKRGCLVVAILMSGLMNTASAYAGYYMTVSMLLKMAESEEISMKAMAAGYVAAIHDEFAGKAMDDPMCFIVPKAVDMEEMVKRTVHFVDWFADNAKKWPKDEILTDPANELVLWGLIKHFPCKTV